MMSKEPPPPLLPLITGTDSQQRQGNADL